MGEKPSKTNDLSETLAYGMWACGDGREVLFNRRYRPIWTRQPGELAAAANPSERIPWTEARWLYRGRPTPADRLRCDTVLEQFKAGLPVDLALFLEARYGDGLDAMIA